ncbi:outer membrane beta-barrel protein [uncultured Flavobacterium sp.]|uniref:outer membrane protein n=1 Tax=uncultured Flavobacterium sp. TaxID=165435 RepID=UPI0030EB7A36|tara:strand:+ start:1062 stop:1958 length:897 start_codon:yes stop_codon:yes gene_type:complete
MWKKNNVYLVLLLVLNFSFAQEKKVDTVYVYEEIIIRDTVYVEKPLDKIKIDKVTISSDKKGKKPQLTIIQNNKKTIIAVDTLVIEKKEKSFDSNWKFGSKFNLGFIANTLLKEFNAKNQQTIGLGVFVKKAVFHPNFSIGTGFETFLTINESQINNADSASFLNGYYFTDEGSPKLFETLNTKGFQFQIPVQFYWEIKKFTPSFGVFGAVSNYESTFKGSSGNLPLTLDESQKFNAKTFYFGYLFQVEYAIYKQWSIGLSYSYSNTKKIVFKQNGETFAIDKKLTQNTFGISFLYHF